MVVVDGPIAILQISHQSAPTAQAVLDRLGRCRAIRDLAVLASEPLSERLGDRLGSLLPQQPARLRSDITAVVDYRSWNFLRAWAMPPISTIPRSNRAL